MFILYGLLLGVLAGALAGGDVRRLSTVSFHWTAAVFAGLIIQVALFTPAISDRVGDLGPIVYVGSTVLVLAAVVRNARIPGLPVVICGALSNLAAIVANGGYMPASPDAMAALGKAAPETYSNSAIVAQPALQPLTDIFALPTWVPFANVFSVGDMVIMAGVAWTIVVLMRHGRLAPAGPGDGDTRPTSALRVLLSALVGIGVVRLNNRPWSGTPKVLTGHWPPRTAAIGSSRQRGSNPPIGQPSRANPS